MTGEFRLEGGGAIDRAKPVTFTFDGRTYRGCEGDTLASALLANGVRVIGRSFKYHRPRGFLGAGGEDPAGLVTVGGRARATPNIRATEQEIYDGLDARSQNAWPSLRFDVGATNDLLSAFLPAGFYYKTFMGWPGWMIFEPFIRKGAGLGNSPAEPDPDRYEHANRHCDVLVVGAGPAGLAAAANAARSGARVILCEETARCGGGLLDDPAATVEGRPGPEWAHDIADGLAAHPDVELLTRTTGFGYHPDNWFLLAQNLTDHLPENHRDPGLPRQRMWRVRAKRVILATGAIERPLVFDGNDRPGIMLAGAVRTLVHRYGVAPGNRAVIFTNNSSAWQTAFDLVAAGRGIAAIVDTRARPERALAERARSLGIPVHAGATIAGTKGRFGVRSVRIAQMDAAGAMTGRPQTIDCDLVAVSGGWSPNVALFSQSRGQLRWDDDLAAFRPARSWQAERSVGAANGIFELAAVLAEGHAAGGDAAGSAGFAIPGQDAPRSDPHAAHVPYAITPAWRLPSDRQQPRAFIDWQNDVTAKDLALAVREGFSSVEHAKRYTTLGMGTDQGKTSSVNGFGVLSDILDIPVPEVGVTTYRPPFRPVTFGAVAGQHVGRHFHPRRTTAMHAAHVEAGAVFEIVGDWLRPRVYPQPGEGFDTALQRECRAARKAAGVLDASTLGKIDIKGRDAREFLNRIYTNAWLKLEPGRCRYGLMLNEDGMVFDDGVTACLANDHFHMTTTTGGAAGVLDWLENYHQTEWPELEVHMTSVTEQWAVASICGPNSTAIAADLFDDIDPDPETFPFMTWRDGHIAGIPVRVFRISFTGETTYEINIPARYGLWLWQTVMETGRPHGLTPYGTEGMHLLRAEAGFIIAGQDTDGTVTPIDLGMDWAVKKKADFIGKRSLTRSDTARADRRQLVGLLTADPATVIPEGAQVIEGPHETGPRTPMLGHVTSSYFSPALGRSIAFALIAGGRQKMGETVYVANRHGPPFPATIAATDFLTEPELAS